MSLHRVLPVPPALSDRGLAQRWGTGPDSLEGARIMTEKRPSTDHKSSPQILTPPQQTSSSPRALRHSFSSQDSAEDCPSPSTTHPTPAPRKRGNISWEQAEPLDEEAASSICLCQPDPKVPRPRNAFILYRQHYQASVVASNPGLANPQISKVIGDHWRNASEDVKNHWRLLAEEEKARHQRQYPGYRYQPRKSARTSSVSSTLPSDESPETSLARCAKCGGRSLSSTTMMSVTASAGAQPFNHGHRTSTAVAYSPSRALTTPTNAATGRSVQSLASPPSAQPSLQGYRYLSQQSKSVALTPPLSKRSEAHELAQRSPESKRRRVNNSVAFIPVRGPGGPVSPFPFPPHHQRQESLPRLDSLGLSSLHSPFTMGPPPRHQNPNRSEKSLTLAPLQNGSANGSPATADTQAKSLEAMILSIPIVNKIKTLARISAPSSAVTPYSPSVPTAAATTSNALATAIRGQTNKRGLVIAIDAADPTALKQLTRTLAYTLREYNVKVIDTPRQDKRTDPSFQNYLRLVDDYHTLSIKIKEHIAISASVRPTTKKITSLHSDKRRSKNHEPERQEESPLSPKSCPQRSPPATTPPMDEDEDDGDYDDRRGNRGKDGDEDSDEEHTDGSGGVVENLEFPIALLPAWQLTHTDAFACTVEIADRYSPIDHWQWGATAWRGVIGADITVAVKADLGDDSPVKSDSSKSGEKDRNAASGAPASAGPKAGGVGSQGANTSHPSGVEVKIDEARAVIVKGEAEGGVAEGSLRRVGFEVGEWVRSWVEKELGPRGL